MNTLRKWPRLYFDGPIICDGVAIDGEQIGNVKIKFAKFMCWPNAGMNCWMMILRHNFTTDLKKWKISVGCFLAGQGQILDGEDGGGGIMSYKYLSPDCSRFGEFRFGEVSALIAALRSFKILLSNPWLTAAFYHPSLLFEKDMVGYAPETGPCS